MIGYSKEQQLGRPVKPKKKKKKLGKQTVINIEANKKLDLIYKEKKKYNICEVDIAKNCLKVAKTTSVGTKLEMTYAHRHKRDWYKEGNRQRLLSSYWQTVRCCIPCHMIIETNESLTNKVFKKLRNKRKGKKHD